MGAMEIGNTTINTIQHHTRCCELTMIPPFARLAVTMHDGFTAGFAVWLSRLKLYYSTTRP
jgi:hypothetical protein